MYVHTDSDTLTCDSERRAKGFLELTLNGLIPIDLVMGLLYKNLAPREMEASLVLSSPIRLNLHGPFFLITSLGCTNLHSTSLTLGVS